MSTTSLGPLPGHVPSLRRNSSMSSTGGSTSIPTSASTTSASTSNSNPATSPGTARRRSSASGAAWATPPPRSSFSQPRLSVDLSSMAASIASALLPNLPEESSSSSPPSSSPCSSPPPQPPTAVAFPSSNSSSPPPPRNRLTSAATSTASSSSSASRAGAGNDEDPVTMASTSADRAYSAVSRELSSGGFSARSCSTNLERSVSMANLSRHFQPQAGSDGNSSQRPSRQLHVSQSIPNLLLFEAEHVALPELSPPSLELKSIASLSASASASASASTSACTSPAPISESAVAVPISHGQPTTARPTSPRHYSMSDAMPSTPPCSAAAPMPSSASNPLLLSSSPAAMSPGTTRRQQAGSGRVQLGLVYLPNEGGLQVTVMQADEIVLPDASPDTLPDPVVKVALLSDETRSGRRKTKKLQRTLSPVWNETLPPLPLAASAVPDDVLRVELVNSDGNEVVGEGFVALAPLRLEHHLPRTEWVWLYPPQASRRRSTQTAWSLGLKKASIIRRSSSAKESRADIAPMLSWLNDEYARMQAAGSSNTTTTTTSTTSATTPEDELAANTSASIQRLCEYRNQSWASLVPAVAKLTGKRRTQAEAIWELFTSECCHLSVLHLLCDPFQEMLCRMQRAAGTDKRLPEELASVDVDKLFLNIRTLRDISLRFARKLEVLLVPEAVAAAGAEGLPAETDLPPARMHFAFGRAMSGDSEQPMPLPLIAGVFEELKSELLEPEMFYRLHHKASRAYLKELCDSQAYFRAFVSWCEEDSRCSRLGLSDLLVQPLQRLTRYPLLLKAIVKESRGLELINGGGDDDNSKDTSTTTSMKFKATPSSSTTASEHIERLAACIASLEEAIEEHNDVVHETECQRRLAQMEFHLTWPSALEASSKEYVPEQFRGLLAASANVSLLSAAHALDPDGVSRNHRHEGWLSLVNRQGKAQTSLFACLVGDILVLATAGASSSATTAANAAAVSGNRRANSMKESMGRSRSAGAGGTAGGTASANATSAGFVAAANGPAAATATAAGSSQSAAERESTLARNRGSSNTMLAAGLDCPVVSSASLKTVWKTIHLRELVVLDVHDEASLSHAMLLIVKDHFGNPAAFHTLKAPSAFEKSEWLRLLQTPDMAFADGSVHNQLLRGHLGDGSSGDGAGDVATDDDLLDASQSSHNSSLVGILSPPLGDGAKSASSHASSNPVRRRLNKFARNNWRLSRAAQAASPIGGASLSGSETDMLSDGGRVRSGSFDERMHRRNTAVVSPSMEHEANGGSASAGAGAASPPSFRSSLRSRLRPRAMTVSSPPPPALSSMSADAPGGSPERETQAWGQALPGTPSSPIRSPLSEPRRRSSTFSQGGGSAPTSPRSSHRFVAVMNSASAAARYRRSLSIASCGGTCLAAAEESGGDMANICPACEIQRRLNSIATSLNSTVV